MNAINPAILLDLLSPLVTFGYHPPWLKHANGVVLDKPGKPSYDTPASFRIIVLLKTVSKILERVMTVRLAALARRALLLHPNQCGSLPGLSTSDACATLIHEIRTLQRPRWAVSTLFLDIKAGFDNVNASKLRALLIAKSIPSYMVDWVTSFLSERACTLVFQGAPGTRVPVEDGTPQGSPISPLLFLIYVAPLHSAIPKGVMISYVDDFSLTVASSSYRTNIRRLQGLFRTLTERGDRLEVKFSTPKTELIHWRTPSQRFPPSQASIALDGLLFRPAGVVRWLGYWLSPALNSQHHFSHRVSLAQATFSFVKRLSSLGAGVRPFLNHRVAMGLLLRILIYGSDLLTPNSHSLNAMNSFWHRTCQYRWVTNCFYSTPTSILTREACLPPVAAYCRYRRRLAALRIACAPPTQNPVAARLPSSFPSFSVFRAQDSSCHHTRGLSSVYLPLDWRSAVPSPPIQKHLPIDAMTHLVIPLMEGLSRLPLVLKAPPPSGTDIPSPQLMLKTYLALKKRAQDALLADWRLYTRPPDTTPISPGSHHTPWLDKFVAGRIHQMRAGKSYLAAHPSWWSELPDHTCPRCASAPETFSHAVLHCQRKSRVRSLLLGEVSSLGEGSPLWSNDHLIRALGQYITATHTCFPAEMHPPSPPPSPSLPPSPLPTDE